MNETTWQGKAVDLLPVLNAYQPELAGARWTALGNAGGFSGARVWHGVAADGREFALKAHPAGADADRLRCVHEWMHWGCSAGLEFVPHVVLPRYGPSTVREVGGRAWEVGTWMPGRADFRQNPTAERLVAAATAVARLHSAWLVGRRDPEPCPAVARRWRALTDWQSLLDSAWRPRPSADDSVRPHVEAVWPRLPELVNRTRAALVPWLQTPVPVQPCLCDVWHDHVLFTGDRVTGIIDYAAAKVDHVAVDLARLLGSLVPGNRERIGLALDAYRAIRPLPQPELVDVLDWTGAVIGLTNWLRWLYHDGRQYADRAAVAARVAALAQRLAP